MALTPRQKNRYRAIPGIHGSSPDVQAMREVIEVLTGARGDYLYRALTPADLLDMGILQQLNSGINIMPGGDPTIPPDPSGPCEVVTPPAPTGFVATGTFSAVAMYWDQPTYCGHAYTIVYRSTEDDFGTAVQIATVIGRFYADPVDPGQIYYYWIRWVNVNGEEGPLHSTSGLEARTETPVSEIIQQMQDLLTYEDLAQSLQDDIQVGLAVETFLEANWSIESAVDAGGNIRVSGLKLLNNPNDLSKIIFNTDVFAVAPPFAPGQDEKGEAVFIIGPYTDPVTDETTNRVVMADAVIGDATIDDAAIREMRADKITVAGIPGDPSTIAEVIIGNGHIDDAMIGNYIQSSDWSQASNRGWRLGRSGAGGTRFQAYGAAFVLYDDAGNVILDAGGGTYGQAISNAAQQYGDINGAPTSLIEISPGEWAYLASIEEGANNRRFYQNNAEPTGDKQAGDLWYQPSTGILYRYRADTDVWQPTADGTLQHFVNIGLINATNRGTYIANAAMDTLVLAGDVLVIPVSDDGGSVLVEPNQTRNLCSVPIIIPNVGQGANGTKVLVTWHMHMLGQNSNAKNLIVEVRRGNSTRYSASTTNRDDWAAGSFTENIGALGYTYTLRVRRPSMSGNVTVVSSMITVTVVKK